MTASARPPMAHLALLAGIAVAFLIGGQVTFEAWGEVPVRALSLSLALAVVVHAASRFTADHSLAVRSLAWLLVAATPVYLTALLRPEVLVPILALGLVDLAQHRAGLDVEADLPPGSIARTIAGLATVGLLAILAALVVLARSPAIGLRLGVVALAGWALLVVFALRPATRTPGPLLGGAGAFAVSFALLAGPVVPLGPLVTYWVAIAAVAAAVLAVTFSRSEDAVRDEHRVHEQTVRSLPDPLTASLADRVRDVVAGREPVAAFADRLEAALGTSELGSSLHDRVRSLREEGVAGPLARRRALAEVLDVDLDELQGGSP